MNGFHLRDDVERPTDCALKFDVHERFKPGSKTRGSFPYAFADRSDHASAARKNRDDAVTGVTERLFYRFKANKLYPYSYAESRNFFYEDNKVKTEDIIVDDNEGFSLDCLGLTSVDQVVDDSDPELNF